MPEQRAASQAVTRPNRSHPAKFPRYVLDRIGLYVRAESRQLRRRVRVLDPFAGVGRIHDLPSRYAETTGVEIEPEWASCRANTICGDATQLPADWSMRFDAAITSPCYGSRMADHHEAKDSCRACIGTGTQWDADGCDAAPWKCSTCDRVDCTCGVFVKEIRAHNDSCARCRARRCKNCSGSGLSKRYTYRHALRRMPSENSAATLQWSKQGGKYRALHTAALDEMRRVLRFDGLLLVNVKNHIENDVEQLVVEWWVKAIKQHGFEIAGIDALAAPGIRHGDNSDKRAEHEQLIVARAR